MVEIDLKDPYTKEQLDNIIEFENTMIKNVGWMEQSRWLTWHVKYQNISEQGRSICHKERPGVL